MGFFNRQKLGQTLLLTAVTVWIAAGAAVGQVDITAKFKDPAFRAWVYGRIGKTAPAPILDTDVTWIDWIQFYPHEEISDLSGIEYLTALEGLHGDGCHLTALDVSKNTALTYLMIYTDQTKFDLSTNTALTSMGLGGEQLTKLNVSGATALESLWIYNSQLTELDLSKNTALTYLVIYTNQTEFGLSKNTALTSMGLSGEQLTKLNVSGATALQSLLISSPQLTALDLSKNTALVSLDLRGDKLTVLDLSKNTALTSLYISESHITALDLSKNTALADFGMYSTQLTALDLSNNTALKSLNFYYGRDYSTQINKLNVSGATALTSLSCDDIRLTELDVSGATRLEYLSCGNNQLTTLDVSGATALTRLRCYNNQLTKLNLSRNTVLEYLNCDSNQLTKLDLSHNTGMKEITCENNQLTTLNLPQSATLIGLNCGGNQLTTLDLSKNPQLVGLSCEKNRLTTLDLSKNPRLVTLMCEENQLTTLDLSKNTLLGGLCCGHNQLTTLDLSKNTALTMLYCQDNRLTTLDLTNIILWNYLDLRYNYFASEDDIIGLNRSKLFYVYFEPQKTSVVVFNSQGGSAISSQTVVGKVVKPIDPTRSNYSFGGWYRNAACTGNAWNFSTDVVTVDITLYAKWTLNDYTVTWNANGGTPVPTQQLVTHGSNITEPSTITKVGYIFGGWYTNITLTEAATFPITNITEPKTFYAKYIPIFTVTFNATSGTITPASGTTRADSTLASLPTPTKSDYAFNGWFTAETDGEKVTESRKYSANTTIHAQWTRSVYTVTLNPNGGTVTPLTINIGENGRIVSLPTPTKTGYSFDGWFTAATNGEKVTDGYLLSENTIVYARWTAVYTVTFSASVNGVLTAKIDDSPITSGTSVQQGKSVIFTAIPDYGYEVSGWTVNGAAVTGNTTNTYTLTDVSAMVVVTVTFVRIPDAVAASNRLIPAHRPNNELTSIAPLTAPPATFTIGPNPASKSSNVVTFYRNGAKIKGATLHIYDASGNKVATVKSGEWDLRDAGGRLVSSGTYLARGEVGGKSGKRERVLVVVGVR